MTFKKELTLTIVVSLFITLIPINLNAAYFPPNSPNGQNIKDLVLIYSGYYDPANYGGEDISAWPQEQFKPYTAFLDEQGQRQDIFFRDYLFLGLKGPYGRSFHNENDVSKAGLKVDWEWFLDRIFTNNVEQLTALNEETKAMANDLAVSNYKSNVIIMVPFPNEIVTDFGDVDGDGVSENLTYHLEREKVVKWYIDQVLARFAQANYSHLNLKGFYWLKEDMDTTNQSEVTLAQNTANYIHNQGDYIFCWIPWSGAYASTDWASFNFDFAILQPNHFVNRNNTTSFQTITNAANKAYNYGMGVEIEFDGQIFLSDKYRERFYDYLNGGIQYNYMNDSILAYYQDARGVYELYHNDEVGYPIYEDLYKFVKGTYETDRQVSTTLHTFESLKFGSTGSATTLLTADEVVQGNKSMQVDFEYYANSLVSGNNGTDFHISDWSKYDSFRLDVFNPNSTTGYITVIIGDQSGNQHYRYAPLKKKNDWNTIRILISDLAAGTNGSLEEPGTVPIDVLNISYIKLVQRNNSNYLPLPNTYYFDNMRLVEDDGVRLNDLEWLTFGGNDSVSLSKTATTIREQNAGILVNYKLYNVSQAWIEAPTHFKQKDWSNQEVFKVDIYNPNGAAMNLGLKFTDTANQTYYKRVELQAGQWNTVQISLDDLASGSNATLGEGTSSALNINSIKRVDFYQRNNGNYLSLPNHLYFDNVRLGNREP